ncbi:MAG: hypothetical protein L3J46_07860 [Kangiellaceae bacterium]|nr:hypothetical protein [Kangiellaceae bacterium]
MNIDEKIKRELEQDNPDFDAILIDDEGLFERALGLFRGGMKRWMVVISFSMVIIGSLAVWAGYRFYIANEVQEQIFWGVCFILGIMVQGFTKQFVIEESNRISIMREIKRVEVSVMKLAEKITTS